MQVLCQSWAPSYLRFTPWQLLLEQRRTSLSIISARELTYANADWPVASLHDLVESFRSRNRPIPSRLASLPTALLSVDYGSPSSRRLHLRRLFTQSASQTCLSRHARIHNDPYLNKKCILMVHNQSKTAACFSSGY